MSDGTAQNNIHLKPQQWQLKCFLCQHIAVCCSPPKSKVSSVKEIGNSGENKSSGLRLIANHVFSKTFFTAELKALSKIYYWSVSISTGGDGELLKVTSILGGQRKKEGSIIYFNFQHFSTIDKKIAPCPKCFFKNTILRIVDQNISQPHF